MSNRRPAVVGNWKMNGSAAVGRVLVRSIVDACVTGAGHRADAEPVEVILCPPYPYLTEFSSLLSPASIGLGAQDVSEQLEGAFTGEVSAEMLRDVGCEWTIVGHSERRVLYGESDAQVAAKAARALQSGLGAIVCVGETLAERESGHTSAVVRRQLDPVLSQLSGVSADRVMIAYEPVWAIGTGRTAEPAQAVEVHQLIRETLGSSGVAADSIRILYGGSVKPANAAALLAAPDIDGALVGGASLVANDFLAIVRAAARH